jgi:hypothetical protein
VGRASLIRNGRPITLADAAADDNCDQFDLN